MFVYLIRCGNRGGPIKIGNAMNVERRLSSLQTASPFKLTLIAKLPADGKKHAETMERWLHDRFKRHHIRGEWFKGSISMKQVDACFDYAKKGKDWDDVRSENGGNYNKRGKTKKLNEIETRNMNKVDNYAANKWS